jgi:hypothetical protein
LTRRGPLRLPILRSRIRLIDPTRTTAWGQGAALCNHSSVFDCAFRSNAAQRFFARQETMFSFRRVARKEARADKTVDLEEFLRGALPTVGNEPAATPQAVPTEAPRQVAPSEARRLELEERLDEALWETFPASDPIAVSPAQ